MDRSTDHERRRRNPANGGDRNRIAAQVHAVGAARQRDVEAIVDNNACAAAAREETDPGNQVAQRRAVEVAFAHLHEIDARLAGMPHLRQQAAHGNAFRRTGRNQAGAGP